MATKRTRSLKSIIFLGEPVVRKGKEVMRSRSSRCRVGSSGFTSTRAPPMVLYAKAYCDCHRKCTKSRTLLKPKSGKHGAQGRPYGFLAAWLKKGLTPEVAAATAWHHKWRTKITRPERVQGRADVRAAVGGPELFEYERSPWSSEAESEPRLAP